MDTVVPFSGLQNTETKILSGYSTSGISKPVGCDPQEAHLIYSAYQIFTL